MKSLLVVSLILFIGIAIAVPHTIKQSRDIKLHNRVIDTTSHPSLFNHHNKIHSSILNNNNINRASPIIDSEEQQYIIHFGRALTAEEITQIQSNYRITLDSYLPFNSYVVVTNGGIINRIATDKLVKWIGEFKSEYKVQEHILEHLRDQIVVTLSPKVRNIREVNTIAINWQTTIQVKSIQAISTTKILVTLSSEDKKNAKQIVQALSAKKESHFVEARPNYESHNAYASIVLQSNNRPTTPTPFDTLNLKGNGLYVGLADSGIAYSSCYFDGSSAPAPTNTLNTANKVIRYNPTNGDTTDGTGHGSAVAGTIVGDSGTHTAPDNNGIAYQAKVHFSDIQRGTADLTPPADLTTLFSQAYTDGVRTYVLPFGSPIDWYGTDAQSIDAFSVLNPSFLVIVSGGNTPQNLSSLALSKNALVVGCCQSTVDGLIQGKGAQYGVNVSDHTAVYGTHVLSSFSARGPTPDGRLKPDIISVGENLYTANTGACGLSSVSGTSYAAGSAAAAALIARSFFTAGYYPSGAVDPTGQFNTDAPSAVIKAVLINSGQRLGITDSTGNGHYVSLDQYPSAEQGYGRIQLDKVLKTNTYAYPNQALFVYPFPDGTLTTKSTALNCMKTTVAGASIKATLVWTDKAASPASGHILVNDLDLAIVEQSGITHKSKTADGDWDSHNNVEQVELTGLGSGVVLAIHVYGRSVPVGPQSYALVISGEIQYADCPSEFLTVSDTAICPNDCSGNGVCNGLLCNCTGGKQGLDCSLISCPSSGSGAPCNGNGDCDTETGKCTCLRNFAAPDCVGTLPPPVAQNESTTTPAITQPKSPYTSGLLAGLVIAAFFLGAIVSIFLGGYLAVRYLEYRREKIRKDRSTKDEEMN